jgi:hypothetical protein
MRRLPGSRLEYNLVMLKAADLLCQGKTYEVI